MLRFAKRSTGNYGGLIHRIITMATIMTLFAEEVVVNAASYLPLMQDL